MQPSRACRTVRSRRPGSPEPLRHLSRTRLGGRHSDGEVPLNRRFTTTIAAACALAAGAGAVALATPGPSRATYSPTELTRARAQVVQLRSQLRRERRAHRAAIARLRRGRVGYPTAVDHALSVAAATYGVPLRRLRRVATCESTLNPRATNGRYVGLFQFGLPLWSATPYGRFPRTDPYAASLAAAWAFKRGMSRHWPICGRR